MIINKPQFDVDKIKPGQAYWIDDNRGFRSGLNCPCIIVHVKPFTIVVSYYSSKENEITQMTIDINSILNKTFTFNIMKVVAE